MACADPETLSATVLVTIALLGPLHYEGVIVPVLAPEMYDVVHSPVPYLGNGCTAMPTTVFRCVSAHPLTFVLGPTAASQQRNTPRASCNKP